jgi:regulator of sigma E protease
MVFLSTLFYFVITIGVLVFIHELGHFVAARFFGIRADVFALGMGYRLFGFNKVNGFSFGKLPTSIELGDHTDYRVAAFPIGGYVKIAGMIDESLDTDFLKNEPQPWEFRAKPIWQKMIVLSAGVIMNLVLALAIFWGVIYEQGKTVLPVTEIGSVVAESPAKKAGLLRGDRILSVNSRPVTSWDEIEATIYTEYLGSDVTLSILRQGEIRTVFFKASDIPDISEERFGIVPAGVVPVVAAVDRGKPADRIGLMPRDTILRVNNEPVTYGSLPEAIHQFASKEVGIAWKRGNDVLEAKVTPSAEGKIGITLSPAYLGPVRHVDYTVLEAFPTSVKEVYKMSKLFLGSMWQLVVGKASFSKSVGGPVKIAQMANQSAEGGLSTFLMFMALLSISLALLNILPFPALDGGHLLFVAYEGVFGREIPPKVKIALQQTGFFLLLAFMAVVLYNDIANL